jgi:hypothetical protein
VGELDVLQVSQRLRYWELVTIWRALSVKLDRSVRVAANFRPVQIFSG